MIACSAWRARRAGPGASPARVTKASIPSAADACGPSSARSEPTASGKAWYLHAETGPLPRRQTGGGPRRSRTRRAQAPGLRAGRKRRFAARRCSSGSRWACVSTSHPGRPANRPGQPCAAGHRSGRGPRARRTPRRPGSGRSRPSIRRSPRRPPPRARPAPRPRREHVPARSVRTLSRQPDHPAPANSATLPPGTLDPRRLGMAAKSPDFFSLTPPGAQPWSSAM